MEYTLADAKRYARFLVRRACTDFGLNDSRFEVLNNGRKLENFALELLVQDKILKQKENPFIFGAMLGENDCPFASKMKEFLQLLAETHGETEKYDIQLGLYILLHGSKLSEIRPLHVSKRLTSLIIDEDFSNYELFNLAIVFVYTFFKKLARNIYDINQRFAAADPEQQEKLLRLYGTQNRRHLLCSGVLFETSEKMYQQASLEKNAEIMEVVELFQSFLVKNPDLVSKSALFDAKYVF